jgi:hypothetical protein
VRVRVELATRDAGAELALQSAGLLRDGEADGGVVGLVRVDRLAALAALPAVRSVAAAPVLR